MTRATGAAVACAVVGLIVAAGGLAGCGTTEPVHTATAAAGFASASGTQEPSASQATSGTPREGSVATAKAPAAASSGSAPAAQPEHTRALLARHGLGGLDTVQVIAALEARSDDRQDGLIASVRPDYVQLADKYGQGALPIPAGMFYLSVAPYESVTHACFFHNLATCQGELVNAAVEVTVTDAAGDTLIEETLTTYSNGFVGLWLPAGMRGSIRISYDGKSATRQVSTGPHDPTCLTTLKLS